MRLLLIVISILLWISFGYSQQWAGPDVDICENGALKQLGSNDPCVDCCYSWSPAEGLSPADAKNPYVTAKDTTTFVVEVRDKNMKLIGRDEVTVNVVFGNIHFTPKFLIQGSEDSVEAELLTLDPDFDADEIYWDFTSDDLGCSMDVNDEGYTAWIAPGNQYGTISIEARYLGEFEGGCSATASLDVNNGVKDVWAIDHTQPGRIAKNGETLYVLNESRVDISAKPNEGGFKAGIPDWKADSHGSHTPEDGYADVPTYEDPLILDGKTSQYIAGESPDGPPKVTVVRIIPPDTWTVPITIPGLDTLDKLIKKRFTFLKADPIFPCGSSAPFALSYSLPALEYKVRNVEKYNDPGIGFRQELAFAASMTATGKIFHPAATKTFHVNAFGVDMFLCSRLYAELKGSLDFNMEFIQSDSLPDPNWKPQDPKIKASFEISGNFEFAFQPPGYLITASAIVKSSLADEFTFVIETSTLSHMITVDPITATLTGKVQAEGDPGKFEDVLGGLLNVSKKIIMFEGGAYGPWDLHEF